MHGLIELLLHGALIEAPLLGDSGLSKAEGMLAVLRQLDQNAGPHVLETIDRLEKAGGPLKLGSVTGDIIEVDRADLALSLQLAGDDVLARIAGCRLLPNVSSS